jgi:hypothetical protein
VKPIDAFNLDFYDMVEESQLQLEFKASIVKALTAATRVPDRS